MREPAAETSPPTIPTKRVRPASPDSFWLSPCEPECVSEVALSFVITSSPTLCCAYTHPLACPFRFFEIAYVIPVKERNLLDGEFRGADDRGDVGSRSYRGRPTQQELAG